MDITIRNTGDEPIYEQIVRQVKTAVMAGRLAEGEALPSIRLLARELRISVITTKRAYDELEREGFIVTMAGKGSFVAPRNLELMREEQQRQMEQRLGEAAGAARLAGVSRGEFTALAGLLYDEPEEPA